LSRGPRARASLAQIGRSGRRPNNLSLGSLRVWRSSLGMARIRRGPPVPHLGRRLRRPSDRNGATPDSPRNPGEVACRPNPALPSRWAGGSDRLRSDSPTIAETDCHIARHRVYRASVGGFRGESGVSGYGRRHDATAFVLHEGLHLEEGRPECRGRYHPASWRPPRSPDEYAPYPTLSRCFFVFLLFASISAKAFGPGR